MIIDRIIGDATRLPLDLVLSLRSQLLDRPISTTLTILALASSVALATAVEMSTRSLRTPLERTTNALLGDARLSIQAGSIGVAVGDNLEFLDRIRAVPGIELASPIINRTFRIDGGPEDGKPLRLLGIDLLADSGVRSFGVMQGELEIRDPLRLLGQDNAIVISRKLADRLGLDSGDSLPLRSDYGRHTFTVHGILSGTLSEAYGGQVVVLDLFAMQDVLQFGGRVDRIDISLESGADLASVREAVTRVVGSVGSVQRSAVRDAYADSVMSTLNVGIWSIAAIAILLSLFLSFAITSMMVDRRSEELSLLRIAGMSDRRVVTLVLVDTVLVSVVATALGFLAAVVLADPLVDVISRASSFIKNDEIPPSIVQGSTWVVALLVGPPIAMAATLGPSFRTVRGTGLSQIQQRRAPPDVSTTPTMVVWFGAVFVCFLAWALRGSLPGDLRVVLVIASSVVAVGTGLPQLLVRNYARIQMVLGRLIPRIGYFVSSSILDRPRETGATLAVWSAITAALVATPNVVHSLVSTMDDSDWGLYGPHAVLALAQDPMLSAAPERINRDSIAAIRATEGVVDVAERPSTRVDVEGESFPLLSIPTQALVNHGNVSFISNNSKQSVLALQQGKLLMTHAFARRFNFDVGDTIDLKLDRGSHVFEIGGYFRNFAAPSGAIAIDSAAFSHWISARPPRFAVFWTSPKGRSHILDEIERRATSQGLFFVSGDDKRLFTRRVVRQYSDLMLIPVFLIAVIGILSMASLLFGNVVSRSEELALLNAAGATRGDRIGVVVLDGLFLGVVGTAIGIVLGVTWTIVLVDHAAELLGFEATVAFQGVSVGIVALGAVVLSIVAAASPAHYLVRRTGFGGLIRTE